MRRFVPLLFVLLTSCLSACIHHLDTQQGNIISNKTLQELKLGMTQTQVETLLGKPVLIQSFTDRVSYVYSWRSDETPFHVKSLTLFFANGRLTSYQDNWKKAE